MPLKNTVAVERRMDLASLFCMIGRHGPAVALAVIAMVSVLAGFIIYRTVRGKRRKAAAAEDDGQTPGADRDASVIHPSLEESHSSVESTDVSDEGSSDVDVIQSHLKIRHRRAAEKKPQKPYSPPKSDIQVPKIKHTTSDDAEEMVVVQDYYKVTETYAEEGNHGLPSDTYTEAKMAMEAASDCHQGATDYIVEDMIEEIQDNCVKEPEQINEENHEKKEKVLKAECQEDDDVTTDGSSPPTLNNPVYFEQSPQMCENGDDDRQMRDTKTALETNMGESVIHTEDVSTTCIAYGKDEDFEEENVKSIDYSNNSGNNRPSPEDEMDTNIEKAEEGCLDYQVIAQHVDETNLPSTVLDQCHHVTDKVMPPIQNSDLDKKDDLAGEVMDVVDEDHLNKPAAVKFDTQSPQVDREVTIEQKEDNVPMCNPEDGATYNSADQLKEKMLTSDNIAVCGDEHDGSSVALPCMSSPGDVDYHENGLSGITTDAKAEISGLVDFPDVSPDCQPQKDGVASALHEETDSVSLGHQMQSQESGNLPDNDINCRTVVLPEDGNDQVYDPHVQSFQDQQIVQKITNDVFDEASIAADPDAVESVAASVMVEEMSQPHPAPICEDQQSDMENVETATDGVGCNNAGLTALLKPEEESLSDMLSSPQDVQSGHMETSIGFPEVTTSVAPVLTKDISPPMFSICLSSLEQNKWTVNDISSPGVDEESGISSLAVSPDMQGGSNELDMTVDNMVHLVVDQDLESELWTEAQNSLFADDVAQSISNEATTGTVFGSYPTGPSQVPQVEHTDWIKSESLAANEDMFGHEIEDSYHRAMDHYAAQTAASLTSYTDDLEMKTDMKALIEVVEIRDEKKAEVGTEKKGDKKEDKDNEEDYEKTEISIMEATMDHNEWIMESNYQVLPWLNLSSFTQDHSNTNQLPTEECQGSSATDATCVDTTDVPPSAEVKQTSTLSLADENMENNKKVVAVQPMPQNVNVTFRVHYFTQSPYQTVAVTGNQQELGNWKQVIPLERAKDGHWVTVVSLPAESHVEWKFVVLDKGEVCRWEECGNRLLDTGYGDDLLVHKWWGLL